MPSITASPSWHTARSAGACYPAACDQIRGSPAMIFARRIRSSSRDGTGNISMRSPRSTARIQRRLEMLGGDRVVVVVVDLILAGPRHFDRSADGPREQRGLHDIIGLRLAAEAAAEECHVHLHPVDRDPERLGDLVARPLRVLG